MRTVTVFKNRVIDGKSCREVDYVGRFHGFFQSSVETSDGGALPFPVALVERADGSIDEMGTGMIALGEEERQP